MRNLLGEVFSRRGYDVMSFNQPIICPVYQNNENGSCTNNHPCADVVITDQRMPVMSGIELLQAQAKNGCRLTPMNKALITAYLEESEQKALQDLGAFYLAKPFRMTDLSRWLDACEKRLDISTPVGVMRREKRTPTRHEITYCIEAMNKVMTGIVTDFSPSGFCMQTTYDFAEAKAVKVLSSFPCSCTTVSARWSKRTGDGQYIAGFGCY